MATRTKTPQDGDLANALDHLRAGRHQEAESACWKVLKADPGNVDATHLLGAVQLNGGRAALAVPLLERAAAAGDDPRVLVTLGMALRETGDPTASEETLRAALELDPSNSKARLQLGITLLDMGRAAEAAVELRRAAAERPGRGDAPFWLANAMLDAGDEDGARAAYAEAVRLDPGNRTRHLRRGHHLVGIGLTGGAQRHYRWGLALNPGDPELEHMVASLSGEPPARASDDYVAAHFDSFAESFDAVLTGKLGYRTPELLVGAVKEALPAGVTGGLAVLDAGCGTGLCGPLLKPLSDRLAGIDLSAGMIDRARERGVYDELRVAEITSALAAEPAGYDLVVAADVLVYFGELEELMASIARALRPGGLAAVSVERNEAEGAAITASGRYKHSPAYLREAARGAGLEPVVERDCDVRIELGRPVAGFVAVFEKERP